MSTRKQKIVLNSMTSLLHQIVVIVCGFITPRLILNAFGSDVNGLVNSIAQFLGIVSLLDLGVGTVVQSALYKPLAEKDISSVSKIYISATKFFKRLALIVVVYAGILMFTYPHIVKSKFAFDYTALLIGAICISSFAQYYFGIVNGLLIAADQKGYINYTAGIATIILNTIACVVLIHMGASIQQVKFASSMVYLLRPLFLNWYVNHKYIINKKITYTEEPIKQKWNGMAQHFASFVLTGTDNIVLTLFSTLANVSIYSVYHLVINGVFNIFTSSTNGFFPYFGDLWARNEKNKLEHDFSFFEWLIHTVTVLLFGCTGMLCVSFVRVYTKGITDVSYVQPLFSAILTLAYAVRALRLPYNYLILAAGHYKQTQSNYIVAMFMNIGLSVASVYQFGLVGVAVGTFAAMLYQTLWMAWYTYKTFLSTSLFSFFKRLLLDMAISALGILLSCRVLMREVSYFAWVKQAFAVFVIWALLVSVCSFITDREQCLRIWKMLTRRIKNKK